MMVDNASTFTDDKAAFQHAIFQSLPLIAMDSEARAISPR